MPAHIHQKLMAQYAEDALITDMPWALWECRIIGTDWRQLYDSPTWEKTLQYRRKQKTIIINGFEVPEPVREPLPIGQIYYKINLYPADRAKSVSKWLGGTTEMDYLRLGLIHLTQEAAELHAQALLSFTKISLGE